MNFSFKIKILVTVFLLISSVCYSEMFYNTEIGYYLDIPQGWDIIDSEDLAFVAFSNTGGTAVMQVFALPGDNYSSAEQFCDNIKIGLIASGDDYSYSYSGRDAVFSEIIFNAGDMPVKGFAVFINTDIRDYVLLGFAQFDYYQENEFFLLSFIDSFAFGDDEKYVPGPVSQFYYPFPGEDTQSVSIKINGITVNTELDLSELNAAQDLIEREASILVTYTDYNEFVPAWYRYYRIIYKDNFLRLKNLFELLEDNFKLGYKSDKEKVLILMNWIQNFGYYRTGTTSDLTSPLETGYYMSGDCDSRSLLFVILLNYLNIDSILLVSSEYSHSAVGVDIGGTGARIEYENRDYLFTELTDLVEIGMVESSMSDPAGWICIPLGR
jgi:hypothetical protein